MSEPHITGFINVGLEGVTWVDDDGVSGPYPPATLSTEARQWIDSLPATKVTFSGIFDAPTDAT